VVAKCTAKYRVSRAGRRSGKTFEECVSTLRKAITAYVKSDEVDAAGTPIMRGPRILVVSPFLAQISMIFEEIKKLVSRNPDIKLVRNVKTPYHELVFTNGATIKGFTTGASTGQNASTLRGQCLSGETLVWMADGSRKKISNIEKNDLILSVTNNGKVVTSMVSKVFDTTEKEKYEVRLRSGRSLVCSKDHRLLSSTVTRGIRKKYSELGKSTFSWNKLKDLKKSNHLATVKNFTLDKQGVHFTEEEALFVGLMAGDGSCGRKAIKHSSVRFTVANKRIESLFCSILDNWDVDWSSYQKENSKAVDIRIKAPRTRNIEIAELLDDAGIWGSLAPEKKLSSKLLASGPAVRAALLRGLIATDGWLVAKNKQVEIGFTSTSCDLASQFLQLVTSFGVFGTLRTREKYLKGKKHKRQYVVTIRSVNEAKRLLKSIGLIPGKEEKSKEILSLANSAGFPNMSFNDLRYDAIKSIKSKGVDTLYDIEVWGTHNFIVNDGVVVHNSADLILLDEADFMPAEDIKQVVQPIQATTPDVAVMSSSTPTGKREWFYNQCTGSAHVKEFYFPSTVLDHWDQVKDEIEAEGTDETSFMQEYMAVFIDQVAGMYSPRHVAEAEKPYSYGQIAKVTVGDKKYSLNRREPSWIYSIGVDWNTNAGVEVVVTGLNPDAPDFEFWVVEAVNISKQNYQQHKAMEVIIDLNQKWSPKFIYVDRGYGGSQIESLQAWSHKQRFVNPGSEGAALYDRLKAYDFGSKVEYRNPVTRRREKTHAKAFLIQNSVRQFEQGRIRFSYKDITLHKQLLNYIQDGISPTGIPRYGMNDAKVGDHRLDALNLALIAYILEMSDYAPRLMSSPNVGFTEGIGARFANNDGPLPKEAMDDFKKNFPGGAGMPGFLEVNYDPGYVQQREHQRRQAQPGGRSFERTPQGHAGTIRSGWGSDTEWKHTKKATSRSSGIRRRGKPKRGKI